MPEIVELRLNPTLRGARVIQPAQGLAVGGASLLRFPLHYVDIRTEFVVAGLKRAERFDVEQGQRPVDITGVKHELGRSDTGG